MKTRLVEGFSVGWVLYKNTIFCGKFLPLGDQKRKSNASSTKDFFWEKRKRKKKKGQMSSYFSRKKNLEILPEMLNGSKNRTPLTSPTLQIGTSNPLGWVLKLDPSCFDSSSPVL